MTERGVTDVGARSKTKKYLPYKEIFGGARSAWRSNGGFAAERLRRRPHGRTGFICRRLLGSATSGGALGEMRCVIEANKSGAPRRWLKTVAERQMSVQMAER